jgi:hypothetical protein
MCRKVDPACVAVFVCAHFTLSVCIPHCICCRLVYFIDDMNMPFVDKYDTQSAIELVRQMVDYRGW